MSSYKKQAFTLQKLECALYLLRKLKIGEGH